MINRIDISPTIAGGISITDLLKPKGKFQLMNIGLNNLFEEEGTLFVVENEEFHFQLSIDKMGLYVTRNGEQCVLLRENLHSRHMFFFVITWSPTRLRIFTAERIMKPDSKEIEDIPVSVIKYTVPCSVPLSLKRWARDLSLIPIKSYPSESAFRNAVYQCLSDLKTKIEDNGGTESFWDYSYKGNKIQSKTPKKETLAQPLIKTIIETELYLRGIDVFRENTSLTGDIDFTVVGSVEKVGVVNMCVELKNAHSKHLENGLLTQLPDYMRSQNSQYGAYCVLNYNIESGGMKERAELIGKLSLWQVASKDNLVQNKIRIFVIDLDKKIIVNKRK